MIINAKTPTELNLNEGSLSNIGSKIKCCRKKILNNRIRPTSATISIKLIQNPSVHSKPHEYPDHYQVVTWKPKWTRWIQTTEKLITTKILQFLIQDQLK